MAAPSVRVFVSSTFRDLEEHRKAVRGVILQSNLHPRGMEDFGSLPGRWDESVLDEINECAVFVGFYAHRYGSRIPDGSKSITEAELDRAQALGIPCLVYEVDPDYRDGLYEHRDEDEEDRRALAQLKKRIQNQARATFTTSSDLAAKVAADISKSRTRLDVPVAPRGGDDTGMEVNSGRDTTFKGPVSPVVAKNGGTVNIYNAPPPALGPGAAPVEPATTIPGPAAHAQSAVPNFVGRDKEVNDILDAIKQGEGASIHGRQGIHGMGGLGKTQLARRVVDELRTRGYGTLLEVNLLGTQDTPMEPRNALAMLHRALDGPDSRQDVEYEKLDVATLSKLFRDRLQDRRAVVLLDNAASRAQVEPLLPPQHCPTLITSRTALAVPGITPVPLGVLPPDKAEELLLSIDGRVGDHAPAIAEACGYLPLALSVVGSLLVVDSTLSPGRLLADLQDERKRLQRMRDPEDPELDVAASLSLSHARLPDDLKHRWEDLGVMPTSFTAWTAADLWKTDGADDMQGTLSRLVRRSLVDHDDATERYVLHDLLRDLARSHIDEERRFGLDLRRARHYVRVMQLADRWFLEGGDKVRAGLAFFDAERANLESAFDWLQDQAGTEDVDGILNAWGTAAIHCASLRLHQREWMAWGEAALDAARRLGDEGAEGSHLGNLGLAYAALGDARKAITHYEQILQIHRDVDDKHGESADLCNLGNAYADLGDTRKAITYYEQALQIARDIGYKRGEGTDLGNLGLAYAALGDVRKAIEYHEQALQIARDIGDKRGEGNVLGNLGLAYAALGDARKAITYYEQALQISREIGDKHGEYADLGNLGNAYYVLSDTRKAIEYHEQALQIARDIGDKRGEGNVLGNLGNAHAALGDTRKAITYYEQALQIARDIGDKRGEGSRLGNLGNAHAALGDTRKAIEHHEQALQISRDIGDRRGEGSDLGNLGLLRQREGNLPGARDAMQQALSLFEAMEARSLVVQAHVNLADVERDAEDFDAMWSHIGAALARAQSEPEVQRALGGFVETFHALAAASSWPALGRLEVLSATLDEGFTALLDALLAWVAAHAADTDPSSTDFPTLSDALPDGLRSLLDACTAAEEGERPPETPGYA